MGTALIERGLAPGVAPESWLLDRAEEIAAVHAAHAAAGAEILLTCTFNLASRRIGDAVVEELAARAVALARAAGGAQGTGVAVAGAVGPTGLDLPGKPAPRAAAVVALYSRAFGALASEGADLLWAESQQTASEARSALRCALQAARPAVVTLVFTRGGARPVLADGAPVDDLLEELAGMGAAAVGLNCVLPDTPGLLELVARVAPRIAVPFVAKPSPGLPGRVMPPQDFGALCASLRDSGASWIGGCCGATAAHVAAAARAVHG